MKILHICSDYFYTTLYKKLIGYLNKLGVKNIVYCPVYFHQHILNNDESIIVDEIWYKKDQLSFFHKSKKIIDSIIRKNILKDIEIIHAHFLFSNGFAAYVLKKKCDIPYIVAVRNTDVNLFFKYMFFLRKVGTSILENSEKIIFLCDSYRNLVLNKYVPHQVKEIIQKKCIIIPNGIDEFWLNNLGNIKNLENKKRIKLLYVGEVNKNKNIITTIKAIKLLQQEGYKLTLTVIGKISNHYIFNKILKYKFVNYIQPKSKDLLLKIYRAHDIFVMPSIHETFGLVYAEAMSQGLPVIYSRNQGFDKQFEEGIVGYSVDSLNHIELAKKIKKIIFEYQEISERALKLCGKFDWNKISEEYKAIYQEILKGDT